MAKKRGLSWEKVSSLADLQSTMTASLGEMIALVKEFLHEQPYSKEEVRYFLTLSVICPFVLNYSER